MWHIGILWNNIDSTCWRPSPEPSRTSCFFQGPSFAIFSCSPASRPSGPLPMVHHRPPSATFHRPHDLQPRLRRSWEQPVPVGIFRWKDVKKAEGQTPNKKVRFTRGRSSWLQVWGGSTASDKKKNDWNLGTLAIYCEANMDLWYGSKFGGFSNPARLRANTRLLKNMFLISYVTFHVSYVIDLLYIF